MINWCVHLNRTPPPSDWSGLSKCERSISDGWGRNSSRFQENAPAFSYFYLGLPWFGVFHLHVNSLGCILFHQSRHCETNCFRCSNLSFEFGVYDWNVHLQCVLLRCLSEIQHAERVSQVKSFALLAITKLVSNMISWFFCCSKHCVAPGDPTNTLSTAQRKMNISRIARFHDLNNKSKDSFIKACQPQVNNIIEAVSRLLPPLILHKIQLFFFSIS